MTAGDYKTLVLAALGGALEFYDFIIFVFFANVLGALFFPPEMPDALRQVQTFGIFAAGYLARPLGGIVMAHFGDLLGRKRMFTFSIILMAASTLGMGLLPTYSQISIGAPILLLLLLVSVMIMFLLGGRDPTFLIVFQWPSELVAVIFGRSAQGKKISSAHHHHHHHHLMKKNKR